jgi:hypothetical protein
MAFDFLSMHVAGTYWSDVTMAAALPDGEDDEGMAALPGFPDSPKPGFSP